MTVAEVVPVKGGTSLSDSDATNGKLQGSVSGKDRLHGLNLQGIHPLLVPAIPSPEDFKESCHYPVLVTLNPFGGKQVGSRGGCAEHARRCDAPLQSESSA
jgi:hypothetical protein